MQPSASKPVKKQREEQTLARIIAGIARSHTPTVGFTVDGDKRNAPVCLVAGKQGMGSLDLD